MENQLLHASLLCGMKPDGEPAYRLQLFLVANKHLQSGAHQNGFQKTIETGADVKGLWDNYKQKGSGHYVITLKGHQTARHEFGNVLPLYKPLSVEQFGCRLRGTVQGFKVQIHIKALKSVVFINNTRFPSAKAACQFLQKNTSLLLQTKNESAVRVLYDLAIDYSFDIDLA